VCNAQIMIGGVSLDRSPDALTPSGRVCADVWCLDVSDMLWHRLALLGDPVRHAVLCACADT
jgi:hypothetical protein